MKTVHIVCARLRRQTCKGCPAWEQNEYPGKWQKGCYGLAAELMNIVKHGGPWKGKPTANRNWRKRVAKNRSEVC